jgi:hypothetical protein
MLLSLRQLATLFGIAYGLFVVVAVVHLLAWVNDKRPRRGDQYRMGNKVATSQVNR